MEIVEGKPDIKYPKTGEGFTKSPPSERAKHKATVNPSITSTHEEHFLITLYYNSLKFYNNLNQH